MWSVLHTAAVPWRAQCGHWSVSYLWMVITVSDASGCAKVLWKRPRVVVRVLGFVRVCFFASVCRRFLRVAFAALLESLRANRLSEEALSWEIERRKLTVGSSVGSEGSPSLLVDE